MNRKTVTINGTVYDTRTGLPVEQHTASVAKQAEKATKNPTPSHAMHQRPQKSQALNRRVVKSSAPVASTVAQKPQRIRQQVAKSPSITKFAPHPTDITKRPVLAPEAAPAPPPMQHPAIAKAQKEMMRAQAAKTPSAPKPAQVIKHEAAAEALENAPMHNQNHQQFKQPRGRFSRFMSVGSATIALLLLGGYFTYLNMPNLSVRVAAAQAGVDASYPDYRPDGYSLAGAVGYTQGEVSMKFASNGGPQDFTLSQKKSSWDSSAVLDNYVKEKAGDNYITYSERGLTIYTYGSNAAWVNNGVFYTIDGDAPLSSDQIRRIATSM